MRLSAACVTGERDKNANNNNERKRRPAPVTDVRQKELSQCARLMHTVWDIYLSAANQLSSKTLHLCMQKGRPFSLFPANTNTASPSFIHRPLLYSGAPNLLPENFSQSPIAKPLENHRRQARMGRKPFGTSPIGRDQLPGQTSFRLTKAKLPCPFSLHRVQYLPSKFLFPPQSCQTLQLSCRNSLVNFPNWSPRLAKFRQILIFFAPKLTLSRLARRSTVLVWRP